MVHLTRLYNMGPPSYSLMATAVISIKGEAKINKISEPTMTRKLRHELPEGEKAKILALIDEIAERRVNNE